MHSCSYYFPALQRTTLETPENLIGKQGECRMLKDFLQTEICSQKEKPTKQKQQPTHRFKYSAHLVLTEASK